MDSTPIEVPQLMVPKLDTPSERKLGDTKFESPKKRGMYKQYSLQFKIKLIKEAKLSNNLRKTALDNDVNHSLLRYWKKNETKLLKTLDPKVSNLGTDFMHN